MYMLTLAVSCTCYSGRSIATSIHAIRSSKYSTRCVCALVAFCPSAGWQHSQKAQAGHGPGTPKRRASLTEPIAASRATTTT